MQTVCEWYFEEWGCDEEWTLELLTERIRNKYINSREIPLLILAMEGKRVIAACQIKFREMKMYPDFEHWIGGVYTSAACRGRGVAEKLIRHAVSVAVGHGVETLYLQTEQLDGGLYRKMGWKPVERVIDKDTEVLVMKRKLI